MLKIISIYYYTCHLAKLFLLDMHKNIDYFSHEKCQLNYGNED